MDKHTKTKGIKVIHDLQKIGIMRLGFIALFFILVMSVNNAYAQIGKISVRTNDESIGDVLEAVEGQTDYSFVYDSKKVDTKSPVSVDVENGDIYVLLAQLFEETDIAYTIVKDKIILNKKDKEIDKAVVSLPPQNSVSGVVTDENGEPMIGVAVMVEGTTIGVLTDIDGKYTINVPSRESQLSFSYIGYKTALLPVGNNAMINVTMETGALSLDEVVVVGYGTQSKAMVSTAISSVSAEKLSNLTVTDPAQAMVGQIAGVRFQQATGNPGSSPYIRVRGTGSLTSSNSPLFVIDGYPTDDASVFNAILPNDIESIDILKDAASAAIYGSRAGNGVILVTTKSGKAVKTKFTFDAMVGVQSPTRLYEMSDGALFAEVAKEARTNLGLSIPEFLNQPERWVETDYQDLIFRTAPYQNYQLGASGGNEKMNYNVSLGYLDNQGILINSWDKRFSLRASLNANLTDKVKIGFNIAPTYSITRNQSTSGGNTSTGVDGILADAVSAVPLLPAYKENGDYYVICQDAEMKTIFNDQLSNPLNKLDANLNYTKAFRQTGNLFLSYEPIKGLTLKTSFNLGVSNSRNEVYREAFLARGNGHTGNISTPNLAQITASRNNVTGLNYYWSNTANYNFKLGDKHNFTALVGYDVSMSQSYSVSVTPRTDADNPVAFINMTIKNVSGAILTTGSSSYSEYVMDALFARLNYSYDAKYIFSGSLRKDRSSRFGPDNRAGIFPSASLAWIVSKESFMDPIENVLSTFKIRTSYGITGNDRLSGSYPWLSTMSSSYYNFGLTDTRVLTYAPAGFSNSNLGWELNKQFDLGFDFGFLKDRITLNVDLYERHSNTIISASIPTLNGKASTSMQNVGNIMNKGLEITVHSNNFVNEFTWQTDFNISFNRNEITELNGDAQYYGSVNSYVRNYLGHSLSEIYAYNIVGTFNNADDINTYAKYGTQNIGDLRYEDLDNNGVINTADMKYLGNATPKFSFGLTNSFTYKGFDLNIILDGQYGAVIVNQFERAISLNRHLENTIERIALNRWKSEEDPGDGKTPRAGSTSLSSNITNNSRYVFDSDFVRVRNISLGYTVPSSVLKRINISGLRVFVTMTNVHTFTSYPGFNPEGSTNGDSATNNGYDIGSYPLARNTSVGVNLSF